MFFTWTLNRLEVLGPLALMSLTGSLLEVKGQVDERWGASPGGFPEAFAQRWLAAFGYFALAAGCFMAIAGARSPGYPALRTYLSTLVTAALFSQVSPMVHHVTGSLPTGWAFGVAVHLTTLSVAQFWCPHNSTYQLWLPFAGLSDASAPRLALSKAIFTVIAGVLFRTNMRILETPERLIGRSRM